MKKKIIFITGASHSGSTLMGCILGAGKTPFTHFHIGEAYAYFNRNSKKYGDPRAAGKTDAGSIWNDIDYQAGYKNAYQQIFEKTGAQVLIDSSKAMRHFDIIKKVSDKNHWPVEVIITYRPFAKIWQSDMKRSIKETRKKKNILTYWPFAKIWQSNIKRKKETRMKKNILTYRLIREHIIEKNFNYTIVNMEQLILLPHEMTVLLCNSVNIPYFSGKEKYWNFPSCHLYGSSTQRRHINKPAKAKYDKKKVFSSPITPPHPFLEREDIRRTEDFFVNNALKCDASILSSKQMNDLAIFDN